LFFIKQENHLPKKTKIVNYVNEGFSESLCVNKNISPVCRWGKFVEMTFNCSVGEKFCLADKATNRSIQIDKILEEPNGKEILKRMLSTEDVFNMGDEIVIDSTGKLEFYKEYLKVLKETNNEKIDSNENEEVLLLIIIKS
jgi:plasmid stability protein